MKEYVNKTYILTCTLQYTQFLSFQGFPGINLEFQGFQGFFRSKIKIQGFPGGVRTLLTTVCYTLIMQWYRELILLLYQTDFKS